MTGVANLTSMEVDALTDVDGGLNLTDGHARLPLLPQQRTIVEQIPEMFAAASRRAFPEIEQEAHATFLNAIGQHSAPVGTGRILSCYSSTLATDIVARALPVGATASKSSTITRAGPKSSRVGLFKVGYLRISALM